LSGAVGGGAVRLKLWRWINRLADLWIVIHAPHNAAKTFALPCDARAIVASGTQTYQDIRLLTRSGRNITVGTDIASTAEAQWLVAEMNKAMGKHG
jgi:hypothetical protein